MTPPPMQPVLRVALVRSKLEAMLLEFLQAYPHCKEATHIAVRRLAAGDLENQSNWTLETYNSGLALREHCDTALKLILPIVQSHFDLAPDA